MERNPDNSSDREWHDGGAECPTDDDTPSDRWSLPPPPCHNADNLVDELLGLPDDDLCIQFSTYTKDRARQLGHALKSRVDREIEGQLLIAQRAAEILLLLAKVTGCIRLRALGLRAKGNVLLLGLRRAEEACHYYDEAANIYVRMGCECEAAIAQVGKIQAFVSLGRIDDAIATGNRIIPIFRAYGESCRLADAMVNISNAWAEHGNDVEALSLLDQAKESYEQAGEEGKDWIPSVENNRAYSLRVLGQLDESIAASHSAIQRFEELGWHAEKARAIQGLMLTRIDQGHVNEALKLGDQAYRIFTNDKRMVDAAEVTLQISEALIYLRQFEEVLKISQPVRTLFESHQMPIEQGRVLLNTAVAAAGVEKYTEALGLLDRAHSFFHGCHARVDEMIVNLERATVLYRQRDFHQSLEIAIRCASFFMEGSIPTCEAQAYLLAARSAIEIGNLTYASDLVNRALTLTYTIPSLDYQGHYLCGIIAERYGQDDKAYAAYERALTGVEHLRGQLMIEFRADFLGDKQEIYEDVVRLCLHRDDAARAFDYAERAKSRALLDMLDYRFTPRIRPRRDDDREQLEEIERLQSERNRLYRRLQKRIDVGRPTTTETTRQELHDDTEKQQQAQREIVRLEEEITKKWHGLLVHNADYIQEASLQVLQTMPVQSYLEEQTLLIEYFICHQRLYMFLVTRDTIDAIPLACDVGELKRVIELIQHNLHTTCLTSRHQDQLTTRVYRRLEQLYDMLIAPAAAIIHQFPKLIIVPHGLLHGLPFHALRSAAGFLLEQHEISYLPAASMVRHCSVPHTDTPSLVAFGTSWNGYVPQAVYEAQAIAAQWGGSVYVEEAATRVRVQAAMREYTIVHIATHGEFHQPLTESHNINTLFAGLELADGRLTTLDIFGLQSNASLVTLSACETGRSDIRAGDELFGLTRAFLSTGTASLVLTLWSVEDRSTTLLMQHFYKKLTEGWGKGAALRDAQIALLRDTGGHYRHPYYWAPFILVGHTGTLACTT